MHVLSLRIEAHLPLPHSLKEKRAVIKPVIEGARRRFGVSSAEVDHQELWQRTAFGFAVVSGDAAQAERVIDEVERFVWSFPEIEVITADRSWSGD